MKTNTAPRNSHDSHPPLARDAHGNPIAVPDGTAAWCFKRETGGRPKMVVGPDRHPVRFPLAATPDDVEEVLGAGTYRAYAMTEVGDVIDYVTTIVLGDDDDADGDGGFPFPPSSPLVGGGGRGANSDLRFALETMRDMSRYQADAMKALALAQADWVKGLATAKALPRNAPWTPPPAVIPAAQAANDDDDHDEGDEAPEDPPYWLQALGALTPAVNTVAEAVKARFAPPPAPAPRNAASSSPRNPMIHLAQINQRLSPFERKFISIALTGEDGAKLTEVLLEMKVREAVKFIKDQIARVYAERDAARTASETETEEPSPEPAASAESASPSPPADFMAHVLAVSNLLTAEERATVLWLLPRYPADRMDMLKRQLLAMPIEHAAAWIRENLPQLRAEVGS